MLKAEGHEIILFTNRSQTNRKGIIGNIYKNLLKHWLLNKQIEYDEIVFCDSEKSAEDKYNACQEKDIDIMVENQKLSAYLESNVCKVILINRPYNIGVKLPNIVRVNNFETIYKSLLLRHQGEKKMNLNLKRKLFNLKYHPTILEKKYIPQKNEIVIFCGNHLSELDSKLVSSATNRNIYWLNDNYEACKRNLKSGKSIGIFPEKVPNIYRLVQLRIMELENKIIKINNNHYLRSADCMISLAYLEQDIRKEIETLERTKKELESQGVNVIKNDVLLPFNEQAVKLAYETNTKIVPFAVDYSNISKKHPKIRFGEPMTISDNIQKENEILRNEVKQLIYKNH